VDPYALAFIAIAAVLHAVWNILLKTAGDPLRTATVGMVAACLVVVPAAAVLWLLTDRPAIPTEAWLVGLASGVAETAYFVFLSQAYRQGDLSVVYPIARGTAPLIAVAIGVLILGERLAPAAWLGVALLLAGLLVVQRPWRMLGRGGQAPAGAGFALLTGAMIATYSAFDRVGVQLVPPWLYAAIIWPAMAIGLVGVDRVRSWRRAEAARAVAAGGVAVEVVDPPVDRRRAVVGGLLTLAAYGFVLAALARAPLAIVAPLRESAVVLTSLWGVLRFGEAADRREVTLRIGGSLLVLTGAVVLAVGR
jgi:uncharacterized membrane protein